MKMVGIIFALLMILNLGTASLSDHCLSNPISSSCNEEMAAPCGTDPDHTSENHNDQCHAHCSHPVPFLNNEISIDPIEPKKTDIKSDLICDSTTTLEGPFRHPLS